jgi:hypothetical protein
MQYQITTLPAHHAQGTHQRSWLSAYGKFLLSSQESLILKIAPLAFLIGAPELIASEFLPIIGEISDIGAIVVAAIVVVRTMRAVSRYR